MPPKGPTEYATWMFARTQLDAPMVCLAGLDKPSVAVRASPRLYRPHATPAAAGAALCDLPHRCVFAVLTLTEVVVYDTHSAAPLAVARNPHYAALTDAAWAADGR